MPLRYTPLVTDEIYHVVNRGNNDIPIFLDDYDYQRFIRTFCFYQNEKPPMKLSNLTRLPADERKNLPENLRKTKNFLVEIIAYCLMPNHFHFLLKQVKDTGISEFLRLTTNSYSKYFNNRHKRNGSLFGGRFRSTRIETEAQLLHVSRYIHLNPYSSFVVKNFSQLENYPYSSLGEYLEKIEEELCDQKKLVLSAFKNKKDYQRFVLDQAEYQRSLDIIKHKILER